MNQKTIVLTGTHFTPALALIEKLIENNFQIYYLGRKTSLKSSRQPAIERQLLSTSKVKFYSIVASKIDRHNFLRSFLILFTFPIGLLQSLFYLKKSKSQIVLSFGGYISFPVGLAARILNIPLILHEQTLSVGLTNKVLSKLATKIAISWPQSHIYFPRHKTVLTGNPIRKELLTQAKKTNLISPKLPTIYITGGNQGSKIINRTVTQILPQLLNSFHLIHQFGLAQSQSDYADQIKLKQSLPKNLAANYILKRWFSTDKVAKILSLSSLVISRAGINTITELILFNKPAILIPLPFTQKNEQVNNAEFLKLLKLAVIIPQNKLSPNLLLKKINLKLNTPLKPKTSVKSKLIKNGTDLLYQLILKTSGF